MQAGVLSSVDFVENALCQGLGQASPGVAIPAVRRSSLSVVWKKFLAPIDSDHVLQRAGHAGFLVRFQLWEIDNQVCRDHLTGDQVLMVVRRVGFREV